MQSLSFSTFINVSSTIARDTIKASIELQFSKRTVLRMFLTIVDETSARVENDDEFHRGNQEL